MLTVLNLFTLFQPKEIQNAKEKEDLKTAQESSDISEIELEERQLKTAVSYCDVVTAREPKITESHIFHAEELIKAYE
uniref:Uncharacterized protein n=1 Tax=Panagrolaimus sp. PS1159 TaxID=55785 RepID=A0AC35FV58_9BILA